VRRIPRPPRSYSGMPTLKYRLRAPLMATSQSFFFACATGPFPKYRMLALRMADSCCDRFPLRGVSFLAVSIEISNLDMGCLQKPTCENSTNMGCTVAFSYVQYDRKEGLLTIPEDYWKDIRSILILCEAQQERSQICLFIFQSQLNPYVVPVEFNGTA